MEIKLSGLSPLSFMMATEGDILEIKQKSPNPREIRISTQKPPVSYLVFKDITKIGMLPRKIVAEYGELSMKTQCRVIKIDKDTNTIIVEI